MSREDGIREANWTRMRTALTDAAREYRRVADELEAIQFENSDGLRSPEQVISRAALLTNGNTAATMVHRLACWTETINEIDRHAGPETCGYTIDDDDPRTICVLEPGHRLPYDEGPIHVSASGVMFA